MSSDTVQLNSQRVDAFFGFDPQINTPAAQNIKTCIKNYAELKDKFNLFYRIKELILSIFGLSDWQKARQDAIETWKLNPRDIRFYLLKTPQAWNDLAEEVMQAFIQCYFAKDDECDKKIASSFKIAEMNLWIKYQYKITKHCLFDFHRIDGNTIRNRNSNLN